MKEWPPTHLIQTSSLGRRSSHHDACREVIFVESVEVTCRTSCRGRKLAPGVLAAPVPSWWLPVVGREPVSRPTAAKRRQRKHNPGDFLVVQWLGLWAFTAKGTGSIPDRGTKIPQAVQCSPPPKSNCKKESTAQNMRVETWRWVGRSPNLWGLGNSGTYWFRVIWNKLCYTRQEESPHWVWLMGIYCGPGEWRQSSLHSWCLCVCACARSVVSDSLWPYGL